MNIIEIRQQARLSRINKIQESFKEDVEPDIDKLVMLCCSEWGISKRTAKEMIEVAKFNIENDIN